MRVLARGDCDHADGEDGRGVATTARTSPSNTINKRVLFDLDGRRRLRRCVGRLLMVMVVVVFSHTLGTLLLVGCWLACSLPLWCAFALVSRSWLVAGTRGAAYKMS